MPSPGDVTKAEAGYFHISFERTVSVLTGSGDREENLLDICKSDDLLGQSKEKNYLKCLYNF